MREHPTSSETPSFGPPPDWSKLQRLCLLTAAVGAGVFALGFFVQLVTEHPMRQFFLSYLVGYIFWLGLPLGSLALLMIQYLAGGRWGYNMRRVFEANTRTLPLMAVLFVPVGLSMLAGEASPYWWAHFDAKELAKDPDLPVQAIEELEHKVHDYLNVPFALARAVGYFLIWATLIYLLNNWASTSQMRQDLSLRSKLVSMSGPGLMLNALIVTFAATDWVMSLETNWASTMFPVIFFITGVLSAFAFTIAVMLQMIKGPLRGVVTRQDQINMGSFMLAFTMFWSYTSFSQFMLIWIGNLPEEIGFFLKRNRGGWQYVAYTLGVFHFAVPFVLLLFRDFKESNRWLTRMAVFLMGMCALDAFWWIQPSVSHEGMPLFWLMDIGSLAGIGGLWGWVFTREYSKEWKPPVYEAMLLDHHAEHAHHE